MCKHWDCCFLLLQAKSSRCSARAASVPSVEEPVTWRGKSSLQASERALVHIPRKGALVQLLNTSFTHAKLIWLFVPVYHQRYVVLSWYPMQTVIEPAMPLYSVPVQSVLCLLACSNYSLCLIYHVSCRSAERLALCLWSVRMISAM